MMGGSIDRRGLHGDGYDAVEMMMLLQIPWLFCGRQKLSYLVGAKN